MAKESMLSQNIRAAWMFVPDAASLALLVGIGSVWVYGLLAGIGVLVIATAALAAYFWHGDFYRKRKQAMDWNQTLGGGIDPWRFEPDGSVTYQTQRQRITWPALVTKPLPSDTIHLATRADKALADAMERRRRPLD